MNTHTVSLVAHTGLQQDHRPTQTGTTTRSSIKNRGLDPGHARAAEEWKTLPHWACRELEGAWARMKKRETAKGNIRASLAEGMPAEGSYSRVAERETPPHSVRKE